MLLLPEGLTGEAWKSSNCLALFLMPLLWWGLSLSLSLFSLFPYTLIPFTSVSTLPPMVHPHLLHVALTRKTKGKA